MQDASFRLRVGAAFRAVLNDLKRDERVAATELRIDEGVHAIIAGEVPLSDEIVRRATTVWPVNERDFMPLHDDCPQGAATMTSAASLATSRTLSRGGKPYYEYRDTAMSRVSSLRPEWIRMLQVVDDCDPENPSLRWNNGHFLFQFTYFVGPVNYYYEWNGKRYCEAMNTGDSVFGLPYAPHTFASRDASRGGHILALTYGASLAGDIQHELGVLGEQAGRKLASLRSVGAALRGHLENGQYTVEALAELSGLGRAEIEGWLEERNEPSREARVALARALRVSERELVVPALDTSRGVVIVKSDECASWTSPAIQPSYRIKRLACSSVTPFVRALEVFPLRSVEGAEELEVGLHVYGYNHGGRPLLLAWRHGHERFSRVLEPGASFYLKPFVRHSVGLVDGDATQHGRILLLRVGGRLGSDARLEASAIGEDAMRRVVSETSRWYGP